MSEETLYLVAHKVSGTPAFDVAIQMPMNVDGEEEIWWIIPTSGHRAYPYWSCELSQVDDLDIMHHLSQCPDPWPDHYWQPTDPKLPDAPTGLAALLKVKRSAPTITRR